MNISIILAHPDKGSFNHAIAATAQAALTRAGHDVVLHDLCAEGFDPNLTASEIAGAPEPGGIIEAHCREISQADGIVIVHPNWWGMPPAILAGWVDRVFRAGVCYRFVEGDGGEGTPVGLMKARSAVVLNTSNTYPEREAAVFGDPLETIWRNCVFGLCGVRDVHRRTFGVIVTSSLEEREGWLREVEGIVTGIFKAR